MDRRRVAWGTGAGVVLAAGNGAVINELHNGWLWSPAAVVLAVGGDWLAARLGRVSKS